MAAVDARYRGATAAEKLRTDVEHRPGVSKPANSSRGGPLPGDLRRAGRRDEWRRPGGLTRNLSHRALAWGLVLEGSRRSPTRAAWRLPQAPQWTGSRGRVHGTHPRSDRRVPEPAGPRADFGLGPCLQGSSSCARRTRRNRAAGADRPPDLDTSQANNPLGHPPEAPVANAPRCGARWCQRARRASCGFSRRCTARRAAERRCSSSASPRTTT